jgi:predicted Zn-dependent peptidase
MLDRSQAPTAFPIEKIKFPSAEKYVLDNGLLVNCISLGDQPVFKFELCTPAGGIHTDQAGLASLVAQMMKRGTRNHTAQFLNQTFDFYGAFWEIQATLDQASFTVYGLSKHFDKLMPYVVEMIQEALFSEEEFTKELEIEIQKNKLNWEKTAYSASQLFRKNLFGSDPYGRSATPDSLAKLNIQDLKDFYQSTWAQKIPTIFISGKISKQDIEVLNQRFGSIAFNTQKSNFGDTPIFQQAIHHLEKKENALQSSIRVGQGGINRGNPDYFGFSMLNTLIGGFFGSRLQKNIREEKGFTYGISSSLAPMHRGGYWVVGTDVKNENVEETLSEIKKEVRLIQEELVGEEELNLVKNYLMGSFTGELTQAFDIAEKVKIIEMEGLSEDYYDLFQSKIIEIRPKEIRDLANQYLDPSQFTEVVVGGN